MSRHAREWTAWERACPAIGPIPQITGQARSHKACSHRLTPAWKSYQTS
ncbi:hypothetical protein AWT69_004039 [Pseudomonas putida]|nr:hypothetical protein AWT69_004039 [Pseudomonas putida]